MSSRSEMSMPGARAGAERANDTGQSYQEDVDEAGSSAYPDRGPGPPPPVAPRKFLGPGGRLEAAAPWLVLASVMAAFFAVTLDAVWASYLSILPEGVNGATDLAIMMQALSSTAHGYIPFYESSDCVHTARCSLLLVHPTIAMFALAPFYGAAPTPLLLFTLQSAAVALAAVPLYLIARDVTHSRTLGVVTGVVYLLYLPTISSIGFSFHIEPLLPLELFTLFWLWRRERYRLGVAVAILSFLTLEVTPVLVFFFGLFFLWPYLASAGRHLIDQYESGEESSRLTQTVESQLRTLARSRATRPARAAIVLMVMGLVAYVALRLFVEHSTLFGLPPLPSSFLLPIGQPNPQVTYSFTLNGTHTANWFLYWLFAFALLGFVGWLVPRTLILAIPWVGYTLFTISPNYTELGLHYGVVAAIPLLIGFAYGLGRLPLRSPPPSNRAPQVQRRWRVRRTAAWSLVAGIVVVNLALTPLGPLAGPLAQTALPVSPSYATSLSVTPGAAAIEDLVGEIPSNGIVVAPILLMPYVANDIYAYPYPPGKSINLPFHVGEYPKYLIADPGAVGSLDATLASGLYSPGVYGVLAIAPSTQLGLVTLFEKGYTGAPSVFGPDPKFGTVGFSPSQIRVAGNSSKTVTSASVPYGNFLQSRGGSLAGQQMFSVPAQALMPGSYQISMLLWAKNTTNSSRLDPNYLTLNVTRYNGLPIVQEGLSYSAASAGMWVNTTAEFSLTEPMYSVTITTLLTESLNAYLVQAAGVWITQT